MKVFRFYTKHLKKAPRKRRLSLLLPFLLLFSLGVAGACAYLNLSYSPEAGATSPVVVARPVPAIKAAPIEEAAVTVAPKPKLPSAAAAAVVPQCTPDSSYQLPQQLTLSQNGLDQVVDTPSTYAVYGNSSQQVLSQILSCTPVHYTSGMPGTYAASTAYAINWQFNYSGDGMVCTLSNVKVGLHVNQVFPDWQTSGDSSMSASWQAYINKLHAYENGHVQLDQAEGEAVLNDLQNFPPTDCGTIEQAANAKAQADVNYYDAANAGYDTANGYGLKQDITL